jgi:hypothetical protein
MFCYYQRLRILCLFSESLIVLDANKDERKIYEILQLVDVIHYLKVRNMT